MFYYLFQSEVTVFFDKSYYNRFYYQQNLLPDSERPSKQFAFDVPPEFVELGIQLEWDSETDEGEIVICSQQCWTIGQSIEL